jgi:hypothetical protein
MTGMAIHAGKWPYEKAKGHYQKRGLVPPKVFGRSFAEQFLSDVKTYGCIRTTEAAMRVLKRYVIDPDQKDRLRGLWVIDAPVDVPQPAEGGLPWGA